LFTWLTHAHPHEALPKTTNPLEGGINTAAKELLRKHRGLTAEHAMQAIGWLLYFKTEHPADPWTLVTPEHWQPTNKTTTQQSQPERIGPALYDTAFSYQDGNGIQQGWGGRSR
jgi:hypothetical protein